MSIGRPSPCNAWDLTVAALDELNLVFRLIELSSSRPGSLHKSTQ